MKFAKAIVKSRFVILIVSLALLVPAALGMIFTRTNYDMLNYLPDDLETVQGQQYMLDDFGKGAFSFIVVEDMPSADVSQLKKNIEQIDFIYLSAKDVVRHPVVAEIITAYEEDTERPDMPKESQKEETASGLTNYEVIGELPKSDES